ncbi:MAG: putative polymerase with domain, hydrolase domain and Zn ribbon [Fibrobacteres bacterium]|nr:putative polymerase with domain, hydrolase domain and Zn ribbon [Fibrobacterota bacterium]
MLSGNPDNPIASPPDERTEAVQGTGGENEDLGPARIAIRVSDDKLKAWISVHPPLQPIAGALDADFVLRRWREMGLDPEGLPQAVAKSFADEWNSTRAVVAERLAADSATHPVAGADARIEYIIDPSMKFKPTDQGGNVDFRNLNLIKPVKKGQPLAKKIPAALGMHGIDLFGQPAPAPDGEDIELPLGVNTEASPTDPNIVVASVSGFLQQKDGKLSVNECFVVDGSVDYSTGNIAYDQSAMIRGDIADGFTVNVGGALEVGGGVGEAKLIVGGDVLIKKGFVGSGHGLITAKGGINLGFSSNQTIRAHGDVVLEKESFNCQIYSRSAISVFGPLVGGLTMAFKEINCRVAGNELGTKTELEAGMDYILHENKILLEEKIKELTQNLAKINVKLTRFREVYRTRKRFTSTEAKLMLELRDMQDKIQAHLPGLEKRRVDIIEQIRQGYLREGLSVKVEKKVNPGVVIKVGPEVFRVQEEMSGPKLFLYQLGRIKVL